MENESLFEFTGEEETGYERENFEFQSEAGEVFSQEEVNELAAELLSVSNQQELNYFLGDLIKKAGSGLRQVVSSPLGQQLGGMLKTAARAALPAAGAAIGNALLPGAGGVVGGKLASMAGSMFGLETEGLSPEDRQYEVAKQFVRFGGDATQKALALTSSGTPIPAAAKTAVQQAAERYVPGLVASPPASDGQRPRHHLPHRGTWVRHGNKIVIHLGRE